MREKKKQKESKRKNVTRMLLATMSMVSVLAVAGCGNDNPSGNTNGGNTEQGQVQKRVIGIEWKYQNGIKTEYYEGDKAFMSAFSGGTAFNVLYSDGTKLEIESDVAGVYLSQFDSSIGVHQGYLEYESFRLNFTYTVKALEVANITIKTMPVISYYADDKQFDVENSVIAVEYNSKKKVDIQMTLSMLGKFDNSVGTHNCVVTYGGVQTSFVYTVKQVEVVSGIIKNEPIKHYYTSSTQFNLTGATITVTYNSGKTEDVKLTADMVGVFDNSVGTHTAIIRYNGKVIDSFDYVVEAVTAQTISVITSPKTSYYTSDTKFNIIDATINVVNNDGSTEEVSVVDGMMGVFDSSEGTHTGTIYYQNKTTTFEYTVVKVQAVEITKVEGLPTKYLVGDNLNLASAIMTYKNNDGTNGQLQIESTHAFNFSSEEAGDFTLQLVYELASLDIDYKILAKQFISTQAINSSTKEIVDMGCMFVFTRDDVDSNTISVRVKENLSNETYTDVLTNSTEKTFVFNEITYTIEISDTVVMITGNGVKYELGNIATARQFNVYFQKSTGCYYVAPDGSKSEYYTNTVLTVYKGEKLRAYPVTASDEVATGLYYNNDSYNFGFTNKYFEFYAIANANCYATIEKATRVKLNFKLKAIDYSQAVSDIEFKCEGKYIATDFKINNSELVQGVTHKEGDFIFTDQYMDGCGKVEGEDSYIATTYEFYTLTKLATTSKIGFRFYSSFGSGSTSGDKEIKITAGDVSTYTQTLEVDSYRGRIKLVLEISVEEY